VAAGVTAPMTALRRKGSLLEAPARGLKRGQGIAVEEMTGRQSNLPAPSSEVEAMGDFKIKPAGGQLDAVALGEVMMRIDPGDIPTRRARSEIGRAHV